MQPALGSFFAEVGKEVMPGGYIHLGLTQKTVLEWKDGSSTDYAQSMTDVAKEKCYYWDITYKFWRAYYCSEEQDARESMLFVCKM
ncbi:hypothetical protein TELCIR_22719 [Teladorsagia circumcincta]|uniref:C-type lectin domain-containing protein n=1 Tax=Teladorsagia circumcincta TaxID=45464 RepID=A0A2G9TEU1_TELCI|nr:hypothetical protein TELCIR_22719 [Teladorsagia circumcincta]